MSLKYEPVSKPGRVTDDKDRRYLLCCLADFYSVDIFDDAYKLSPSGLNPNP